MASFYVIRGKDYGQHFAIRGANATIGREATNQIQLRDSEVSRKHARILRSGDANFDIVDNKSSNGTFVNGRRVESHTLKSGDRVQIGKTLMIFTGGPELHSTRSFESVEIVTDRATDDLSQIRSSIDSNSVLTGSVSILDDSILAPIAPKKTPAPSAEPGETPEAEEPQPRDGLEIVYQVSQAINRTVDLNELLGQVLELIFQHIECDRGCILVMDDVTSRLTPVANLNRLQAAKNSASPSDESSKHVANAKTRPLSISSTILEHVCGNREGVLTSNAQDDARWEDAESVAALGVHEAICVPMLGRYGLVGVVYVDTTMTLGQSVEKQGKSTFDESHLKLVMSIAAQAALAVEDTQFYQAMVQSERLAAMGQTIANLSHHVKNVLQGVSGGNYLIDEGLKNQDLDVIRKGWTLVQRNQQRISDLVMDMLNFSKERTPELTRDDVCGLIDDVVTMMRSRAKDEGVELHWEMPSTPLQAAFDSEAMHRALLNVVTNAIDAAREGLEVRNASRSDAISPRVTIEIEVDDDNVQIRVSDNGIGIPEDVASRIFHPFESTKGSSGTGLGLPVSQKVLREHGGDITFRTKPDVGTEFLLRWPVYPDGDGAMTMVN